jgi:hypothetical protein
VDAGDRPAGATSPTASSGPTLIDAVTYFSWLLEAGATGILPVYAAVGGPRGFAARTCGRGDGVLRAARDLPLGAVRDAVRDNPARLLDKATDATSAPRHILALIPAPAARRVCGKWS